MTTKINDLSTSVTAGSTPTQVTRSRNTTSASEPSDVAPANSAADVHITGTASQLASLEQALRDAPAVDQNRVSALRAAIEQGTYQIRPAHVAERFLHLEHALGSLSGSAANSAES